MNVTKEVLKESEIKLTITLETDDLAPYLDRAAAKISKDMNVSGFRPGHVPRNIVEEKVGAMPVLEEAVQMAVPKTLEEAFKKENVNAVGQPKVSIEKIAPGNAVVFSAEVAELPELELPDFSKLSVKEDKEEITDKKVEETLEMIQGQRATFKQVDRAAEEGDQVKIDFVGRRGGVKVEGAEGKDHPLEIGSNQFIPGFEEKLIGAKKGEEKKFEITFPKDYHAKALSGAKVEFEVTVQEVSEKKVPELNDEFAKTLGEFKTLDEFKKKLRENLEEEAKEGAKKKLEQDVLEAIVKKVDTDIPDIVTEGELDRMISEMKERMGSQGGTFEQYLESIQKSEEEFRKEQKPRAKDRALANIVVYQVAKEQGIDVDDKELDKEHQEAINRYQFDKKILEHVKSDEYRGYLKTVLTNRNTIQYLVKAITGVEETPESSTEKAA